MPWADRDQSVNGCLVFSWKNCPHLDSMCLSAVRLDPLAIMAVQTLCRNGAISLPCPLFYVLDLLQITSPSVVK